MEAQHRKKDPVRLHRQLLESAAMIAGRDGIAALSLNAVAREAGVSKGGLLHHFPNKQALIFALFARLLAIMEKAISELMAADNIAYGRFTRAYLRHLSNPRADGHSRKPPVDGAVAGDAGRAGAAKMLARLDAGSPGAGRCAG